MYNTYSVILILFWTSSNFKLYNFINFLNNLSRLRQLTRAELELNSLYLLVLYELIVQYYIIICVYFRADSVSWNPHKMAGAPLQCSVFMVRKRGLLHRANAAAAQYLFQQDKFYDVRYDTGDKSVQCGRKVR